MDLAPIRKSSASAAVFEQLLDGILSGQIEPGETLPAERQLTDRLAVNRQAVREALQRLSQSKLVRISQGEPTRVLDPFRNGGLDLLPHLLFDSEGTPQPAVVRSVMEMRAALGPDVARYAAQRATPETIADATGIVKDMADRESLDELASLDLHFWDLLVDAADNIAYRLAFNSLRSTYEPLASALSTLLEEELRASGDRHIIVTALASGDDEGAASAAARLLARGTTAINLALNDTQQEG